MKGRGAHEDYLALYLGDQARLNLEKRINGLARRGVLADWGYAVPVPSSDTVHIAEPVSSVHAPELISVRTPARAAPPLDHVDIPTSPIEPSYSLAGSEVDASAPTNLVPVRQIGTDHEVTAIPTSQLTDKHNIVLLMGPDDPRADLRHTIDLCPLHRTVRSML